MVDTSLTLRTYASRLSSFFGRLVGSNFSRDVAFLYIIHICTYVLPIVTVPFLARMLGPNTWGLVAFFQSFALTAAVIVEFGFGLSATRKVARHRDSQVVRSAELGNVTAAKLILAGGLIVVVLPAFYFLDILRSHPALFVCSLIWALSQGGNMAWYYQGIGNIPLQARMEILSRTISTILIFLTVRGPADAWWVPFWNGMGALGCTVAGICFAASRTRFSSPTWFGGLQAIREGWAMFLYRATMTVYTMGNGFVLGLFASPALVGYYSGAERITRGFVGLLQPLIQMIYSKLNYSLGRTSEDARGFARFAVLLMSSTGAAIGIIIFLFAPLLIRILLGHGYEPALPVLRLFAVLPPLVAVGISLGMHWMLPLGLDRPFNIIVTIAAVIDIGLAILLAPRFKQMGMCVAVLASEAFVALSCFFYLRVRRLDPFSIGDRQPDAAMVLP